MKRAGLKITIGAITLFGALAFTHMHAFHATESTQTKPPVRNGQQIFQARCAGCHALDTEREGPRLRGVYGRTSGTVPTFQYSTALKNAHIVWTDTTLDQWLTDPTAMVPGTNMDLRVPREDERRALVQYLQQLPPH